MKAKKKITRNGALAAACALVLTALLSIACTGNPLAPLAGSPGEGEEMRFSVTTNGTPYAVSSSPAQGAKGLAVGMTYCTLNFSEPVYKGNGFIQVKNLNSGSLQDISISNVTFSNSSIKFLANTPAYSTTYSVLIGNTCVKDADGNYYAGIASTSLWKFTTIVSAPPPSTNTNATPPVTNNVCTLSALSVGPGTLSPVFSSGTTFYQVALSVTNTTIHILPVVSDYMATLKINGTSAASGTWFGPIPLAFGTNSTSINAVVTARDGFTKKTYTIVVRK